MLRNIHDYRTTARYNSKDSKKNEFKRIQHEKIMTPTLSLIREDLFDLHKEESVDYLINIRVSDAKLRDLKQKRPLVKKLNRLFGFQTIMSYGEFDDEVKRLYKCCLKSVRDLHELHVRRCIGMDILEDIVARVNPEHINISHIIHLTWCVMSCIHHFQLRLKTSETGLISWARKKKLKQCLQIYGKLVLIFNKDMYRIAVNAIITFYREGRLWEIEFACTDLIVEILLNDDLIKEDLDDMVFTIENATLENPEEAKYLTKILCEIMRDLKWSKFTMYLLINITNMLESSIKPKQDDIYNYSCLRKGLELCIRHAITHLSKNELIKIIYIMIHKINTNSDNNDVLVCFGNIAIFASYKYSNISGRKSFMHGPLPIVFSLFKDNLPLKIFFGLKIWQRLIDRRHNLELFTTPKIFFRNTQYFIVLSKCQWQDKQLFKKVRHLFYEIIFNSFIICNTKAKLETVYQTLALTLIEIPCGYTASCVVTIAMSIQEYAFGIMAVDLVRAHHLHATVLALLTLICYIHNAKIFYKYVNTIIERRAELAPHLNPPLKTNYEYAQHHVLWNKTELFFEDWEARYGLWKCFRGRRNRKSKNMNPKNKLKNQI